MNAQPHCIISVTTPDRQVMHPVVVPVCYVSLGTGASDLSPCLTTIRHDPEFDSLRIESIDRQHVRVTNLSEISFVIADRRLGSNQSLLLSLPASLASETATLKISRAVDREQLYHGCERMTMDLCPVRDSSQGRKTALSATHSPSPPTMNFARSPAPSTLVRWFKTLALIQRQAGCSAEFYAEAVAAIVDPGGLESGLLLEKCGDAWRVKNSCLASRQTSLCFEPEFAELVRQRRETLMYHIAPSACEGSQAGEKSSAHALFAAPVFDENMQVAFVLYGSRQVGPTNRRHRLRELEALWIQLVAESMTSGFIRLKQETSIARQRLLLERSMPAGIVARLSQQDVPELLMEEREITIMFADLVDSSSLAACALANGLPKLQGDVMDEWTSIIHRHEGTIVDYYGDGLVAMWNAPNANTNHALLACQSALEIVQRMPVINSVWQSQLGRSIEIGMGVHTGTASVGNSGSRDRLKYGPRGAAVHIASRIEHATRNIQQPLLISDATRQQLPRDASAFRLGKFRLRGFAKPIVLYALHSLDAENSANDCCRDKFCELQRHIIEGDYDGAARRLSDCQSCELDDLSLQFLHGQLAAFVDDTRAGAMGRQPAAAEPIFELDYRAHQP